jgi:phosphatidate phosphatase APP1
MTSWRKSIRRVAYNAEGHYDRWRFRVRKRLNRLDDAVILPYCGHGSRESFHLRGRVLEDRPIHSATDADSAWRNFRNTLRRFKSAEIRGARVRARFGNAIEETLTDQEGYFEFHFEPDPALLNADQYCYNITLDLVDYPGPRRDDTRVTAPVVVPPPEAEFGVISDLDDTVIKSDVVNLLKLMRNTFLKNARTRLPFEGVAAFYQALQAGTRGAYNPIYYVSSSPWNLYDLIAEFFQVRGIPAGPLFLAELGLRADQFFKPDRRKHKLNAIKSILETHPNLPFLLIGDSGELDPEIYLQSVLDHPGRVKTIYIRDVGGKNRHGRLEGIAKQIAAAGAEMLLVKDTVAAAAHASDCGYILPETLPHISDERSQDKLSDNPIERLIQESGLMDDIH